jgi:hypothetical protein
VIVRTTPFNPLIIFSLKSTRLKKKKETESRHSNEFFKNDVNFKRRALSFVFPGMTSNSPVKINVQKKKLCAIEKHK